MTHGHGRFLALRWTIYLVLVLSYMLVYFHRMAPGVVSADLMATFGTTGAALGSLAAMYYYIYTAMQIPSGVLADTLGPRVTVAIGNAVAGAGSILFGLAETLAVASAGRLLVGLGVSVVFVALMKSNTVWFRERQYGLISGLTLLLGNLGSVLAAGPLAAVLGTYSWRAVFVAVGAASLVLALATVWLVRNRPQDAGFPSVREMEGGSAHAERQQHWWHDLIGVLRTPRIWPGFWFNFGMAGGLFAFAGLWGIPLLRDIYELQRLEAAQYTTATLLALAIGTLLAGWASDRLGRRRPVMLASAAAYCVSWLAMLYLPWGPGWSGLTLYALVGFAGAGFVVSYPVAKEVIAPALSGMAISVVNTGLFLGAAIMQPLFGWTMDRTWDGTVREGVRVYAAQDYRYGLMLMLAFAAVALLGAWRIRETHCRNQTLPHASSGDTAARVSHRPR
jgi:sugar phosphate permease